MSEPVSLVKAHRRPRKVPMPLAYLITVPVLCLIAVVLAVALWVDHVDGERERAEREADRRWCALLTTLDRAYTENPPQTVTGIKVAAAVRTLRLDLRCPQ